MSYWERLDRYRTEGPEAVGKFELRPAKDFSRIVGEIVDRDLLPLGWSRRKGLQWLRPAQQPWAEQVIDFQPLKSGVGARWGLRLSFVPRLKSLNRGPRDLDLSHDPLDYQRDVAPWALSRFATDDELREDGHDLAERVGAAVQSLDACSGDLPSLAVCFEAKRARKAVRLGFYQYPKEVLAFAAVLGLMGRAVDGLREARTAFDRLEIGEADRKAFELALADLWSRGI